MRAVSRSPRVRPRAVRAGRAMPVRSADVATRRRRAKPLPMPAASTDPVDAARASGLRYVRDDAPGIRRLRAGGGFRYVDAAGRTIRDEATLARIRALVVPPAWREVWICARADGHIQATGRDARGRKQYRYHPRWRATRDETKYGRMLAFAAALPRIRARVEADLSRPGLPREKVLATVVRLLETTFLRVGNEEYARRNHSHGLTTLHDRHVAVNGSSVAFRFRGKAGKMQVAEVNDRRLARIVRRCRDLPGWELFQYLDESGATQAIDAADVNAYLREIAGDEFTAKDFRTWAGTVLAALALAGCEAAGSARETKRNVARAVEATAQLLGNTPAVCRKCYVHPAVIDAYADGVTLRQLRDRVRAVDGLHADEAQVLALLRRRLERAAATEAPSRRGGAAPPDRASSRRAS
jgi:DNA topoisomerase-1